MNTQIERVYVFTTVEKDNSLKLKDFVDFRNNVELKFFDKDFKPIVLFFVEDTSMFDFESEEINVIPLDKSQNYSGFNQCTRPDINVPNGSLMYYVPFGKLDFTVSFTPTNTRIDNGDGTSFVCFPMRINSLLVSCYISWEKSIKDDIYLFLDSLVNQKFNKPYQVVVTMFEQDYNDSPKKFKDYLEKNNIYLILSDYNYRYYLKYYALFYNKRVPIVLMDEQYVFGCNFLQVLYDTYKNNKRNIIEYKNGKLNDQMLCASGVLIPECLFENIDIDLIQEKIEAEYKDKYFRWVGLIEDYAKKNGMTTIPLECDSKDSDGLTVRQLQSLTQRTTEPLVSVIVPCYNVEQYIDQCILSIINNGYSNIEILCIDDMSTDNTVEHIKELQKQYSCIKLYSNETTHQLYGGGCRNIGLEHAKGKYVEFVDSDDFILSGLIQECVNKCETNNADICAFKFINYNLSKGEASCLTQQLFGNNILCDMSKTQTFNYLNTKNIFKITFPNVWSKFYNLDFIKSIKAVFQEGLKNSNDVYFNIVTLAKARRIVYIDKEFYLYRQGTKTSVQMDSKNNSSDCIVKSIEKSSQFVKELKNEVIMKMFDEFVSSEISWIMWKFQDDKINQLKKINDIMLKYYGNESESLTLVSKYIDVCNKFKKMIK